MPVDFSETSMRALQFARLIADACGASLDLLHVVGPSIAAAPPTAQDRTDICRRLDELLDATDRDRRGATTWYAVGTPSQAILDHATAQAVDLIAMGTHLARTELPDGRRQHRRVRAGARAVSGSGREGSARAREAAFDPPPAVAKA